MVSPSSIAHIVFRTNQLDAMVDWYCTVLEAHVTVRIGQIAFLTYDDEHHRVAIVGSDNLPTSLANPRVGFFHAAFAYGSLRDLLDTGDRLERAGIFPTRLINHGPTISYYFSDPDGNEVELQVDRFRRAEDATELMNGETFLKNPIGVIVSADDLRARLDAGEAIETIMRRPDEPEAANIKSI